MKRKYVDAMNQIPTLTALQELVLEGNPLQTHFDHLRREPYGDLAVAQFLHVDIGELDLTGASLVEVRDFCRCRLLSFLTLPSLCRSLPSSFDTLKNLPR